MGITIKVPGECEQKLFFGQNPRKILSPEKISIQFRVLSIHARTQPFFFVLSCKHYAYGAVFVWTIFVK